MSFDPYNYETDEDAKLEKDDYHVKLKRKELKLERTIEFDR